GPDHPAVADPLNNLAALYRDKGDITNAIYFKARANETQEHDFVRNLASGSERQKLAYLNQTSVEPHKTISLHINFAPANHEAMRLALTEILRRKGRALDATTDAIATLRRRASPDNQKLLEQ